MEHVGFIWIYIYIYQSLYRLPKYLKFTKLQYVFLLLSLQGHYRVTDEDKISETT